MRARLALAAVAAAAGLLAAAPGAAAQAGPVLVVGDSLELGTGPYLREELRQVELDIDAKTGRSSAQGLVALRRDLRPRYRVVVFDLGVNDGAAAPVAANLAAARQITGDRCLVVSTLHGPGAYVVPANRAIRAFADANPEVVLVDWDAAADPALVNPDGVHPTPAGYARRARVVADGIGVCLAGESRTAPYKRRRLAPRGTSRPAAPAIRWAALGLPSRSLLALAGAALDALTQLTEATLVTLRGERSEAVLGAP
jgi:lysophospholipase L1-like esterase